MELATIQSTADLKASWHSLDERPQKREFVTRRSYQGISSFFWEWIYHVFYHFSRLIHKVLWNPSHPDRCCPGKKREASGLFANDVTRYQIDRQRGKRGKRRGDKVCSFSLSSAHSLSPNPPIIAYLSMFSLLQSLSGTYRSPSLVIPIPVMFHSILWRGRLQRISWE